MPEIPTTLAAASELKGLHLWHAGLSNCSQRVRLVLAEKRLTWTSHPVDLGKFEHATPEYQAIHPKGLVPALIHDGRTIIDSSDIILYLDRTFPDPPLGGYEHRELLNLADGCQRSLRIVSHELLLGEVRRLSAADLAKFRENHANREFFSFLEHFSTVGFDDAAVLDEIAVLSDALKTLNQLLAQTRYLNGAEVGLSDFSWVTNVHRLALIDYPLEIFPHLSRWFDEMRARPSYAEALTAFEIGVPQPSAAIRERRTRIWQAVTASQ